MFTFQHKHICVLCNSLAGAGRAVEYASLITGKLERKCLKFAQFIDCWPETLDGFTDIFIVGGDGTINFFVNKYPGTLLPLVLFNAGTGNDFHWMLYNGKSFDEMMETALATAPKPVDVGICNGRYFINGVGVGFEGAVVKALAGRRKRPGKASFLMYILKKVFTYRSSEYKLKTGNTIIEGKKLLVDISNGKRAGGGFVIAPEARANDGFLDVVIADAVTPFKRLQFLPLIEKGKHLGLDIITHFKSTELEIESAGIIQYHLDGEYEEAAKITIRMADNKLYFRF